jgi:hypothetical protein
MAASNAGDVCRGFDECRTDFFLKTGDKTYGLWVKHSGLPGSAKKISSRSQAVAEERIPFKAGRSGLRQGYRQAESWRGLF